MLAWRNALIVVFSISVCSFVSDGFSVATFWCPSPRADADVTGGAARLPVSDRRHQRCPVNVQRFVLLSGATVPRHLMIASLQMRRNKPGSLSRIDFSRKSSDPGNDERELREERKNLQKHRFVLTPLQKAVSKFKSKPLTYCLIPCIAALVGWFTNYLAVQMIFYPIKYRGISLIRKEEVPLGLLGWQGIVPCKTRAMSEAMVNMVTTQLLSVPKLFQKLDPRRMADLLSPEVPKICEEILADVMPSWSVPVPRAIFAGLPEKSKEMLGHFNRKFLIGFAKDVQQNVGEVLSVKNCVVEQMLKDRTLLGQLFRKCGSKELDFLTNSGLWFGFLLGLIQMVVALFWDNPWSLSIGGGIVGLATNWLALKWIFEPVNPTKVGPFILQGQFLRRQKEVAAEFSTFFANHVLTSEKVWHSILTDPETSPKFSSLFRRHLVNFANGVTSRLRIQPEPEVVAMAASRAIDKLPSHIGVLHPYIDKTLGLRETLRVKMEGMSSEQFERVLHPIFEEDELTLILAGAALGFAAGLIQQGLETGRIKLPSVKEVVSWTKGLATRLRSTPGRMFALFISVKRSLTVLLNNLRGSKGKPH